VTIDSWLLFCSIAFVATASPGPAVLLVTSHSLQYGPRQSMATVLGNISGLFLMSLMSVLGLSTLLLYSTIGFTLIKLAGAAYLIYLGIKLWRASGVQVNHPVGTRSSAPWLTLYRQGIMIALTNPKAIVFTTALFPQFIVTTAPLALQFTLLVTTFMALSFLCLMTYSVMAAHTKMRTKTLSRQWPSKCLGGALISAGISMIFVTQK